MVDSARRLAIGSRSTESENFAAAESWCARRPHPDQGGWGDPGVVRGGGIGRQLDGSQSESGAGASTKSISENRPVVTRGPAWPTSESPEVFARPGPGPVGHV